MAARASGLTLAVNCVTSLPQRGLPYCYFNFFRYHLQTTCLSYRETVHGIGYIQQYGGEHIRAPYRGNLLSMLVSASADILSQRTRSTLLSMYFPSRSAREPMGMLKPSTNRSFPSMDSRTLILWRPCNVADCIIEAVVFHTAYEVRVLV